MKQQVNLVQDHSVNNWINDKRSINFITIEIKDKDTCPLENDKLKDFVVWILSSNLGFEYRDKSNYMK